MSNVLKAILATFIVIALILFIITKFEEHDRNMRWNIENQEPLLYGTNQHNTPSNQGYTQQPQSINDCFSLGLNYRRNLINVLVIEGYIWNLTNNVYKDVVLKVDYYSRTGSFRDSRTYRIDQYFEKGVPIKIKLKEKDRDLKEYNIFKAKIISANIVN